MHTWSEIKEYRGRRRIHIDGKPYLTLGIQYDFLNCTKIEDFDYLFEHTVKMGCNTVFFPFRWFVMEPNEGEYHWEVLDHAIKRCREHGLRMSLLWFGTNQGGDVRPAPEWMKGDRDRFPRIVDEMGKEKDGFCPNSKSALEAETKSFNILLEHLSEVDGKEHTVIMMQIENEICLYMNHEKSSGWRQPEMDYWCPRCYCEVCNRRYEKEGGSEFEFGVRSLIRWLNELLYDQKKIFPVLTYVNFLINPSRPGEDLEMYLNECHSIDFVAPDYYGFSPQSLAFTMRYYNRGRNIPFIAEHSTESVGDADINLYLAVCEHGAQGFDPWAIDHAFGWRAWRDGQTEKPFVNKNGEWSDAAILFGRAQSAMNCASSQVAAATGTEDIMHFVSYREPQKVEERRWGIRWKMVSGKDGKWVCIRTGEGDFTLLGADTIAAIRPVNNEQRLVIEEGYWEDEQWVCKKEIRESALCHEVDNKDAMTGQMDLGNGTAFRIKLV